MIFPSITGYLISIMNAKKNYSTLTLKKPKKKKILFKNLNSINIAIYENSV